MGILPARGICLNRAGLFPISPRLLRETVEIPLANSDGPLTRIGRGRFHKSRHSVDAVGLPAPDTLASVAPTSLVAEGRSIVGSYLGSAVPQRDIPVFVDLWRRGRLPVEELITSRVELGMINEALDALARGAAIRQIIEFPSEELTRS